MGKGDKKSRRGKIHIGSFGRRRRPTKNVFTKPEQAAPVVEKVDKIKKAAPVEEVVQPAVAVPETVEKPVKVKAKKAEAAEPAAEKKTVKRAPRKAKEAPAEGAE